MANDFKCVDCFHRHYRDDSAKAKSEGWKQAIFMYNGNSLCEKCLEERLANANVSV